MDNDTLGESSVALEGCECCNGEYICCPKGCCRASVDWGEKCGTIEWKEQSLPPKVDIYLAVYDGRPMLRIVRSPDEPAS